MRNCVKPVPFDSEDTRLFDCCSLLIYRCYVVDTCFGPICRDEYNVKARFRYTRIFLQVFSKHTTALVVFLY